MTDRDLIDLGRFVASDFDARSHLHQPWRSGKWDYATNGHVCVRVASKDAPDAPEATERHPNAGALFEKHLDGREGEFVRLPSLPPAEICSSCKGIGWHWAVKCPDCKEGQFDHGAHTYDCRACNMTEDYLCNVSDEDNEVAPGWLPAAESIATHKKTCWQCNGCGFKGMHRFTIGDADFNLGYVHWIAALPEVRVRAHEEAAPLVFIFNGGHGLLMPMRRQG